MSDRDCNNCLYATRDGGCASWDCNYISIAEAEPKRGKWITRGDCIDCSECRNAKWSRTPYENLVKHFNYCPNCGAKMEASDD